MEKKTFVICQEKMIKELMKTAERLKQVTEMITPLVVC